MNVRTTVLPLIVVRGIPGRREKWARAGHFVGGEHDLLLPHCEGWRLVDELCLHFVARRARRFPTIPPPDLINKRFQYGLRKLWGALPIPEVMCP